MAAQVWRHRCLAVDADEGVGGGEPSAQEVIRRDADRRPISSRRQTQKNSDAISPARGGQMGSHGEGALHPTVLRGVCGELERQPQRNVQNQRIAYWLVRLTDNQLKSSSWLFFLLQRNVRGLAGTARAGIGFIGNWSSICASSLKSAWSGSSPNHWQCPRYSTRPGQWVIPPSNWGSEK